MSAFTGTSQPFDSVKQDSMELSDPNFAQAPGHGLPNESGAFQVYTCPECTYRTTSLRKLGRHRSVNHGGTKYRCTECDFVTGYQSNFYRHRKQVHHITGGLRNQQQSSTSAGSAAASSKPKLPSVTKLQEQLQNPLLPPTQPIPLTTNPLGYAATLKQQQQQQQLLTNAFTAMQQQQKLASQALPGYNQNLMLAAAALAGQNQLLANNTQNWAATALANIINNNFTNSVAKPDLTETDSSATAIDTALTTSSEPTTSPSMISNWLGRYPAAEALTSFRNRLEQQQQQQHDQQQRDQLDLTRRLLMATAPQTTAGLLAVASGLSPPSQKMTATLPLEQTSATTDPLVPQNLSVKRTSQFINDNVDPSKRTVYATTVDVAQALPGHPTHYPQSGTGFANSPTDSSSSDHSSGKHRSTDDSAQYDNKLVPEDLSTHHAVQTNSATSSYDHMTGDYSEHDWANPEGASEYLSTHRASLPGDDGTTKLRQHLQSQRRFSSTSAMMSLRCPECPYTATTLGRYRSHLARCTVLRRQQGTTTTRKQRQILLRCDQCDFSSYRHKKFQRHVAGHQTSESARRFSCYRCNFGSNNYDTMRAHFQFAHSVNKASVDCQTDFDTFGHFTDCGREAFVFDVHGVRVNPNFDPSTQEPMENSCTDDENDDTSMEAANLVAVVKLQTQATEAAARASNTQGRRQPTLDELAGVANPTTGLPAALSAGSDPTCRSVSQLSFGTGGTATSIDAAAADTLNTSFDSGSGAGSAGKGAASSGKYMPETEVIETPPEPSNLKDYENDPDVKQRTCSICGYQGKWISEMVRHKRVHTAERPFRCKYCSRTSKWKADLIRHVAKVHGVRVVSKYSRSRCFESEMAAKMAGSAGANNSMDEIDHPEDTKLNFSQDNSVNHVMDTSANTNLQPSNILEQPKTSISDFMKQESNFTLSSIANVFKHRLSAAGSSDSEGSSGYGTGGSDFEVSGSAGQEVDSGTSMASAFRRVASSTVPEPQVGTSPMSMTHQYLQQQPQSLIDLSVKPKTDSVDVESVGPLNLSSQSAGGNEIDSLTKPAIVKCSYCSFLALSGGTNQAMVNHLSIEHGLMPFGCPYCGFSSNERHSCLTHVQAVHSTSNTSILTHFQELPVMSSPSMDSKFTTPTTAATPTVHTSPVQRIGTFVPTQKQLIAQYLQSGELSPTDNSNDQPVDKMSTSQCDNVRRAYKCVFCPWYALTVDGVITHMSLHSPSPSIYRPIVERSVIELPEDAATAFPTLSTYVPVSQESQPPLNLSRSQLDNEPKMVPLANAGGLDLLSSVATAATQRLEAASNSMSADNATSTVPTSVSALFQQLSQSSTQSLGKPLLNPVLNTMNYMALTGAFTQNAIQNLKNILHQGPNTDNDTGDPPTQTSPGDRENKHIFGGATSGDMQMNQAINVKVYDDATIANEIQAMSDGPLSSFQSGDGSCNDDSSNNGGDTDFNMDDLDEETSNGLIQSLKPHAKEITKVTMVVNGIERRLWQCRFCPHASKRRANVRLHEHKHLKRALSSAGLLKCDLCPFRGDRRAVLQHKRQAHSMQRHDSGSSALSQPTSQSAEPQRSMMDATTELQLTSQSAEPQRSDACDEGLVMDVDDADVDVNESDLNVSLSELETARGNQQNMNNDSHP